MYLENVSEVTLTEDRLSSNNTTTFEHLQAKATLRPEEMFLGDTDNVEERALQTAAIQADQSWSVT